MQDLPADILFLVCEELARKRDFATLFTCAVSSKSLVKPALLWMYRVHDDCSIRNSSEVNEADFERNVAAVKRICSQWTLQWKSIIRSSLGHTRYPYCLYIRSLDLRNLAELLEDPWFRELSQSFFAHDMTQFLRKPDTPMKQKIRGAKALYKKLDVPVILDLVGESITNYVSTAATQNGATVALEEISGEISGLALPRWVGRISKLKSMTLWDGAALSESVATSIGHNCPQFDDLTFYGSNPDIDQDLASFFSGLKKDSLRSFTALSANAVGPETLLSLNHHKSSLQRLKLDGLRSAAIKNLSLLQGCVGLVSLEIQDSDGSVNLEATENDIFLEVIAWLGRCEKLRELLLRNLASGPAILTQVCLRNNVRLHTLQVTNYPLLGNQDFHRALSHQTSLESLSLKADPEGTFRDDIDVLIASISQLHKLRYLNLVNTSDDFHTSEILKLSSALTRLEDLSFGGYDVTDDLWRGLANLHQLRILNISAMTSFSFDGILSYISALKDSNKGLALWVMSQKAENPLSDYEQSIIKQSITEKVDGKFDFTLFREADSDSESFSD
ncbi:hypothetical protein V8E51_011366 [Hyaloscypha variabilis]